MEIEFLIKVGYRLGISPFRFCHSGNNVEAKASRISKGMCCFFYIAGLCLTLLANVYPELKADWENENPRLLFNIGHLSAGQFLIYSVLYIIWYRREGLCEIVKELETWNNNPQNGKKSSYKTKFRLLAGILLPLGIWMFPLEEAMAIVVNNVLGCTIPRNTSTTIPFLPWIRSISHDYSTDDGCNYPVSVRVLVAYQFLFYFYCSIQWGFVNTMFLACSLSVYRMTVLLHNRIPCSTRESLPSLVSEYKLAKYRIGLVNEVLSVSSLLETVEIVMHVSLAVPFTLARFDFLSVFEMGMSLLVLGSFMVAAESNRLMEEVETFIIHAYPHDGSNIALTLTTSPGDSGLKGWHFFTFSYSFLGSVGSAIFTYVLVIIQMKQ